MLYATYDLCVRNLPLSNMFLSFSGVVAWISCAFLWLRAVPPYGYIYIHSL